MELGRLDWLWLSLAAWCAGCQGNKKEPPVPGRSEVSREPVASAESEEPVANPDTEKKPVQRRGTSAANYEGLFDSKGKYLHKDCSEFELRVARSMYRQLFASDEDEKVVQRKVARQFGLKPAVVFQIYAKGTSECGVH